ncbi:MAG: hypothetical protein H6816_00285 [Phycisphaerales bacterium]|nr:hypothetical protein [Phycisphaerales bacterium]
MRVHPVISIAALSLASVVVHAETSAALSVHASATSVAWGDSVEIAVWSTHDTRMAACSYRIGATGGAAAVLTQRSVAAGLDFINTDTAAPLADGLPVEMSAGLHIDDVFVNLGGAESPGGPDDGLAPGADVVVAAYTLVATRAGTLQLTLSSVQAAETQSDPGGTLFDDVGVSAAAATVTLTVVGGPDIDGDGRVDLHDYAVMQRCLGGSSAAECATADVDADGDVDEDDFVALRACLAGPVHDTACTPTAGAEVQP